jgi:hypothetical protein
MTTPDASDIQGAYEAVGRNDIEPLVALFDADVDWWGVEHGFLWWRKAPG